ncbi:hypothetical protein GOP47_0014571 [Adiantum capillus-veneris]|uniref:Uncharacterized protein n=1 Tax=Adiantum capillus-veneris TaxID=13818 RepID=A0A9D4ULQ9_ADICA|nr:hypothetical protein GOP47_0014571 [Adiantum capillus-veneris]
MADEALIYANEKEPETKHAHKGENEAHEGDGETVVIAEGVPLLAQPAVVDTPTSPWTTGLFSCFGNNDEFFSSDLEVCVLGTFAPCFLYASNVERLHPTTENTLTNHFCTYSGLFCLGNFIFGCNALAPCFSSASRTELRRKYNLMGSSECFAKSCGCGAHFAESSDRECMETVGDFATHYICHTCALCQEGREIRRRMPHPGFVRSFMPMEAPGQQVMLP